MCLFCVGCEAGWKPFVVAGVALCDPAGWKPSVRHVPSSENRSHGASLGGQLRSYCNGTRFKYVFY
jgi:hypothetical protein